VCCKFCMSIRNLRSGAAGPGIVRRRTAQRARLPPPCVVLSLRMPGKHIRDAIAELEAAKWTVIYGGPQAHAYAKARCPDGCCPQFSIWGTPRSDENEAEKIRRKMRQHERRKEDI
jgi:hypothetical protein